MRNNKPLPPLSVLLENFELCIETGNLLRRRATTNRHPVGGICGRRMATGHIEVGLFGQKYMAHRIVYFLATGQDPGEQVVDHINGIPSDNRPFNLRLASIKENCRHKTRLALTNTSGHRNVSWCRTWNRWRVSITVDGKRVQRKFADLERAVECARSLREHHYGEFAGLTS